MCHEEHDCRMPLQRCCPGGPEELETGDDGFSRREFMGGLGGAALGGAVLSGLSTSALSADGGKLEMPPTRRELVVKPILIYEIPKFRLRRSWRTWGGIQTQQDVEAEMARIKGELARLRADAG